ncbi:MAG: glycosyltransferase family 4 protein [Oligoflexia bacterium]|nr:glycosyltransferase family 4 protein [Oligoflexia bacterium]
MKIAFVLHHVHKRGGQERSTLEIINILSKRHEVHIFAHTAEGYHPEVKFHKISLFINRPFLIKEFLFRLLVDKELKKHKFDIINATGNVSTLSNVITVQFCHKRWQMELKKLSFSLKGFIQNLWNVFWEKKVFKKLKEAYYIGISNEVSKDLKQFYNLENVFTIYHGVDANEFTPNDDIKIKIREKFKIKSDETLILFVGTFERKGLGFLIKALEILKNKKIKLLVVGEGNKNEFLNLANKLNISEMIVFAGSTNKVSEYYQAADIFILPSLYDPFGLVGIEAIATSVPSIISKQSGASDFIKNDENGIILNNPEDSNEIASAIEKLITNKELYNKIKDNSRQAILNQTWEKVAQEYEKVFLSKI